MKRYSLGFWFALLLIAAQVGLAVDPALVDLFEAAGVEMKFGGGNPGGRDFDSASMTSEDIYKLKVECKRRGYPEPKIRGRSITFQGSSSKGYPPLPEATMHYEIKYVDQAGSSAAEAAAQSGNDKESYSGKMDSKTGKPVGKAGDKGFETINDLLGKGSSQHHPLKADPKTMTKDQLKDMGKMVAKVMDAGGVKNPELQQQAELLHTTGDPAKAGIRDINAFQQQGRNVATEAAKNESRIIRKDCAQLEQEVRQAQREYDAAKKNNNPQEVAKAKAKLENARGRAIKYNTHVNGTTAKAVANGADDIIAAANGYEPVATPDGTRGFREPKTGKLLSRSAMTEAVCKSRNANLRTTNPTTATKPPPGVKPMGPVMKYGGGVLLVYSIIEGGVKAYEQVQAEMQEGDGFFKTAGKILAYTFVKSIGIEHAYETGREAGDIAVNQYYQDVKDNKISGTGIKGSLWYGFYKFGGMVNGSLEFITQMVVDPVINTVTAVEEGVGAVEDVRGAAKNEAQAKATEKEVQTKVAEKVNEKAGVGDETVGSTGEVPVDKPPREDEQEDDAQPVEPDPDAVPPTVVPDPPANDPTIPPGYTKEFKGYVADPRGRIELHEIKDPEGNVAKVIHTTIGPDGRVLETKEYPVNGPATPADGPVDNAGAWQGSLTFTRVIMPDQITAPNPLDPKAPPETMTRQQCEEALAVGKPRPFSITFRPTSPTTGFIVFTDAEKGIQRETPYTLQDNRLLVRQEQEGVTLQIEGVFAREGDQWILNATVELRMASKEKEAAKIEGDLKLTKPAQKP